MSQDRRGFPEQGNGGGVAGSVRRARERAEAGLPPERPPPEEIPTSRFSPPNKRKPPNFPSRDQQGGIGATISRPSPMPQWPLRDDGENSRGNRGSPEPGFTPKGPPPQRPPRPSRVPSILDSSKIQDYTPSFQARPQPQGQGNAPQQPNPHNATSWENEDNMLSPDSMDPPLSAGATTTRSSMTTSSVGTIPDFPLPATQIPPSNPNPGPPRKYQNLGPPPAAARRGPSSYYSRGSFVSPIPEEFPEQLKKGESLASSKAIPSSWGSSPVDSDILYDEEGANRDEGTSLVREASLGKRGKPSLRTINKNQNDQSTVQKEPVPDASNAKYFEANAQTAGANTSNKNVHPLHRRESSSSSSSEESDFDLEKPPIAMVKGGSSEDINMHRLEKGAGPRAMSDKRPGTKRPPRLDIDAVREAETRGSLTSLSDLIRRATKLATNLDHNRTASRLGMLDAFNGSKEFRKLSPNDRRTSGISDILNSFPPPGLTTPTGEHRGSQWPGPYENTNHPRHRGFHTPMSPGGSEKPVKQPRRRCCGMRPGVFALVSIIVILLIAAAIVVPIVLIVLPQQRDAAAAAASAPSNTAAAGQDTCEKTTPCLNGGVSISRSGSCSCVCVDGFGGERCADTGDGSCTTLSLEGVDTGGYVNATVGSSIPRLLEAAETNFSIPLDSGVILDLFSEEGVSCTSENALVSFNGVSQRRRRVKRSSFFSGLLHLAEPEPEPKASMETPPPSLHKSHQHHEILRRQNEDSPRTDIATENGIIFKPTASSTTTGSAPTETANAREEQEPSSDGDGDIITPQIQDFARIAILFILQETRMLSAATSAQGQIQALFERVGASSERTSGEDAQGEELEQTMGLGGDEMPSSFVLDFVNFRILLEDGTLVGGD
ncbi:hypothetical protein FQN54_004429 [Arachnomyces sp. PD_36]|nr:hypothetical protein FQN54_004429 [Arachnomyces sp. PD_36]